MVEMEICSSRGRDVRNLLENLGGNALFWGFLEILWTKLKASKLFLCFSPI